MDIEGLRTARREMEIEIQNVVVKSIASFYEKTGMSPHCIDIHLVDVTTVGDLEKRYVVGHVCADVHL